MASALASIQSPDCAGGKVFRCLQQGGDHRDLQHVDGMGCNSTGEKALKSFLLTTDC